MKQVLAYSKMLTLRFLLVIRELYWRSDVTTEPPASSLQGPSNSPDHFSGVGGAIPVPSNNARQHTRPGCSGCLAWFGARLGFSQPESAQYHLSAPR